MIKNLKDHPIQSFSYIKQNRTCSGLTIRHHELITSHSHHMHRHIYMHYAQILTGYRFSILHHQNEEPRSFIFKELNLLENPTKHESFLQKKLHSIIVKIELAKTSRACDKPGILFFLISNLLK